MNQAAVLQVLGELENQIKTIEQLDKAPESQPNMKAYYKGQVSGMEYAIRSIKRGLKK